MRTFRLNSTEFTAALNRQSHLKGSDADMVNRSVIRAISSHEKQTTLDQARLNTFHIKYGDNRIAMVKIDPDKQQEENIGNNRLEVSRPDGETITYAASLTQEQKRTKNSHDEAVEDFAHNSDAVIKITHKKLLDFLEKRSNTTVAGKSKDWNEKNARIIKKKNSKIREGIVTTGGRWTRSRQTPPCFFIGLNETFYKMKHYKHSKGPMPPAQSMVEVEFNNNGTVELVTYHIDTKDVSEDTMDDLQSSIAAESTSRDNNAGSTSDYKGYTPPREDAGAGSGSATPDTPFRSNDDMRRSADEDTVPVQDTPAAPPSRSCWPCRITCPSFSFSCLSLRSQSRQVPDTDDASRPLLGDSDSLKDEGWEGVTGDIYKAEGDPENIIEERLENNQYVANVSMEANKMLHRAQAKISNQTSTADLDREYNTISEQLKQKVRSKNSTITNDDLRKIEELYQNKMQELKVAGEGAGAAAESKEPRITFDL